MKSVGYVLIIALFGLVILDTTNTGEFEKMDVVNIEFSPKEYPEAKESKRRLDSTVKLVEKNHIYLKNILIKNDSIQRN